MATTVHEAPQRERLQYGKGGWNNLTPAGGPATARAEFSTPPAGTAVWVGIAAISMSFIAFTSALVVRKGGAPDWRHLTLPPILYLNTLVLMLSSVTLAIGKRRVADAMAGKSAASRAGLWLNATLGLGLLFVAGQYWAWLQLRAQGLYMASSPNSSFFYLFTVIHALHVLGGLLGIGYVIYRFRSGALRKSTLGAATHYWHFMDALWIYLLYVLWSSI